MTDRLREPRVAAVIGIVLAAVVVGLFLLLRGNDGDPEREATGGAQPTSVEELRALPDTVGHPVYWVGEQPGKSYELTITDEGNIFVRYLDPSTPVGSRDVASLTIGTYPVKDAYGALQSVAQESGAKTDATPDGGFVVTNESNPQSVYIAYPDSDYQIEVYDPDAQAALQLATSGAVVQIS